MGKRYHFSLVKDPLALLARIQQIQPQHVQDHVHFTLYWRWKGTEQDQQLFKAGRDVLQGVDTVCTLEEMREALKFLKAPRKLISELAGALKLPVRNRKWYVAAYHRTPGSTKAKREAKRKERSYWARKLI